LHSFVFKRAKVKKTNEIKKLREFLRHSVSPRHEEKSEKRREEERRIRRRANEKTARSETKKRKKKEINFRQ